MNSRIDRINRVLLAALSLLTIGLCAWALSVSYGAFNENDLLDSQKLSNRSPITDSMISFVDRNQQWIWPVAVGVCLVIAYLASRWLRAQLPPKLNSGRVYLWGTKRTGRTSVSAQALADAFAADVESYDGVQRAEARLVAHGRKLLLDAVAAVDDDVDVNTVRDDIESHAIDRFEKAVGSDSVFLTLRLRLAAPGQNIR